MRPGDKLAEELIFGDEKLEPTDVAGLYTVKGPVIAREQILECLAELGQVIERRDLAELLHFVRHIVPDYQPSRLLRQMAVERVAR